MQSAVTVGGGTETLTVLLTETDLTLAQLNSAIISAGFPSVSGSTTTSVRAFVDNGNAAFGMTTELFDLGPFAGTFNADGVTEISGITPLFSLTLEMVVTHVGGTNTSGSAQVTVLSEPPVAAIMGLGLVAAGLLRRRRTA